VQFKNRITRTFNNNGRRINYFESSNVFPDGALQVVFSLHVESLHNTSVDNEKLATRDGKRVWKRQTKRTIESAAS
jgi:hypothetical protein